MSIFSSPYWSLVSVEAPLQLKITYTVAVELRREDSRIIDQLLLVRRFSDDLREHFEGKRFHQSIVNYNQKQWQNLTEKLRYPGKAPV